MTVWGEDLEAAHEVMQRQLDVATGTDDRGAVDAEITLESWERATGLPAEHLRALERVARETAARVMEHQAPLLELRALAIEAFLVGRTVGRAGGDRGPEAALHVAELFHEAYERLAPTAGYETRPETRAFDRSSPNGVLMVAVARELLERGEIALP